MTSKSETERKPFRWDILCLVSGIVLLVVTVVLLFSAIWLMNSPNDLSTKLGNSAGATCILGLIGTVAGGILIAEEVCK